MFVMSPAAAYQVCGAEVMDADVAYLNGDSGLLGTAWMGVWAVGTGCDGATDVSDETQMCTNVIAGGHAICGTISWDSLASNNMNESSISAGSGCWCRRTKMMAGDTLVDSIGQWVLIADVNNSPVQCQENCSRMCAETVAYNANGLRNPIMILSSF